MTFMSNAAGRERDQFGTRMSAGLDWSLGRMPLPFSICGERHEIILDHFCEKGPNTCFFKISIFFLVYRL